MRLALSGLPAVVDNTELCARFVMSSSWVAATTGRVKHPAFLPAPDHDTSIFRTTENTIGSLWPQGEGFLEGRPFHGVALVKAGVVRAAKLDVIPSEPPPSHANIRGWPVNPDDPDLQKSERKKIAIAIAEEAMFEAKP